MRNNVTANHTNKLLSLLYGFRLSKSVIYRGLKARARGLVERISPHLRENDLVLDIGPASCTVSELLMEGDAKVLPLDVRNYSIVDGLSPMLYDGGRMPFTDGQFDASLILFVLHHTVDPSSILLEAMRVSKRIIIYEDIVLSRRHKKLTAWADMLINLEFDDQPHTNKSDVEWLALFQTIGLKLLHREYQTYGVVFRHAMYVVEK